MTNEFRHGTIARTLLATPRRGRFVAVKLLTGAVAGAALIVLMLVVVATVTASSGSASSTFRSSRTRRPTGCGGPSSPSSLAGTLRGGGRRRGPLAGRRARRRARLDVRRSSRSAGCSSGCSTSTACRRVPARCCGARRLVDSEGESLCLGSARSACRSGGSRSATVLAVLRTSRRGHHLAAGTLAGRGRASSQRRGARAPHRLARLRRERGVAARRIRRLRPRRRAGRRRSSAGHEGEARLRRRRRDRARRPSASRVDAPCRHFGSLRRLPLPGPRLRRAGRGEGAPGARRARPDRSLRRPAARADRPRRVAVRVPEQARVLVHDDRRRRRPRVPSRRALGRGDRHRGVPADDRLGNAIRLAVRGWAREERLEAYDQASGAGTSATSSCEKGATPDRRSSCS